MWAQLGTDDEGGRRIRDIAFDNLHELTMDESAQERLDPSAFSRLGEIAVPTLVVTGARDVAAINEVGEILASEIPGARSAVIQEADHMIQWRAPEELAGLVLDFLH
jgi:pimeloyl-ACP methyl ester carboxylesterase